MMIAKLTSVSALLAASLAVAPVAFAQQAPVSGQTPPTTTPGSSTTTGQTSTTTPPAATSSATPATGQTQAATGERRICRNITRTGSRLARERVCRTQAEWDQVARTSRQTTERLQRNDGSTDPNAQ